MKNFACYFLILMLTFSCQCNKESVNGPQKFSQNVDFEALHVDASRLNRIDNLLQEYVDKGLVPQAVTFVAKDGQVIHNKAFGWRDIESKTPVQIDDIFRMYSQTKAIATVALMTLFEQGKFQLDDPVSKYIPEMTDQVIIEGSDQAHLKTRKAESPVLIRHLLSHTSGIAHIRPSPGDARKEYATLSEYVKDLVKAPLIHDPGTKWNYHPSSDVCGYLVEYFSGKTLQDYLEEVIFTPLGIKDMAYYYDASYKDRFVTIYRDVDGKLQPVEMWSGRNPFGEDRRMAQAGTGLNGTIEGYARFCQMILNYGKFNDNRILGRRTIEIMVKNQIIPIEGGDKNFHFGLGFQVYPGGKEDWDYQLNASPMISHGSLSWGGMANTAYLIDHKENMIILLYSNRVSSDSPLWARFLNTVYQTLE